MADLRAAWAAFGAAEAEGLEEHARHHAERVAASLGDPPAVLAEQLAMVDAVAAKGLVLLGAARCSELLAALERAVDVAAPLLASPPDDEIEALDALTVAGCANVLLAAGREVEERIATWLDLAAGAPGLDDDEVERRLVHVVAAVGPESLLAELADDRGASPEAAPEDLASAIAAAVLAGAPADALATEWDTWLLAAPDWLAERRLRWPDLLWTARAVESRLGGLPVGQLAERLRAKGPA
jgi:hypothetical protein